MKTLTLSPIGFLKSSKRTKFAAPHQPDESADERNELELLPGHDFEVAVRDLAGFSRIWLLSWFHKANGAWRRSVLPPRGPAQRRGVFATRSPHRPNALALTAVQLHSVTGRTLIVGPCDLIDGTPVFDIKPYLPEYDAFPNERAGWTEAVSDAMRQSPAYEVRFSPLASEQADWLANEWEVDFRARLVQLLERDPAPNKTRRIRAIGDNVSHRRVASGEGDRLSVVGGSWR